MIAVAVPDDIYLSYSLLILTSAMRISTFSLNPRQDPSPPTPKPAPVIPTEPNHAGPERLEKLDGPLAYVSLLGTEPWKPPPVLSRPSGLPSNPQLSLPGSAKQADFMLTPDTLRYLASTVAHLSGQVHQIQLAHKGAEGRVALQSQELLRICNKCRELQAFVDKLRGPRHQASEARIQKAQDEQAVLMRRLDRMLQSMMEKASPELSEHETKWFEELKRMKNEVMGLGRYDEGSLASRINMVRCTSPRNDSLLICPIQLQREYARLTPNLKSILEKERERRSKQAETNKNLGFSQAFELGQRSTHE